MAILERTVIVHHCCVPAGPGSAETASPPLLQRSSPSPAVFAVPYTPSSSSLHLHKGEETPLQHRLLLHPEPLCRSHHLLEGGAWLSGGLVAAFALKKGRNLLTQPGSGCLSGVPVSRHQHPGVWRRLRWPCAHRLYIYPASCFPL